MASEICCAVGFFLSSRTYEHSSVILYSNKTTLAYTLQSSCSPSLSNMLSCPPCSPGLGLAEHAWVLLRRVRVGYPWVCGYPGGPQKVKKMLAEILPLRWRKSLPSNSRPCGGQCLSGRRQSSRQRGVTFAISFFCISTLSFISMYSM